MKQACLLAIALAGCPTAALAQGTFDYTYVEAYFQANNQDDYDGPGVAGSFELGERWFVFGAFNRSTGGYGDDSSYGTQDPDAHFLDYDSDYKRIGVGFHHPLGERLDFVARAMYDMRDSTVRSQYWDDANGSPPNAGSVSYRYDISTDIVQAEAGARGLLMPRWEGWAFAGYGHASSPDGSNVEVIDLRNPNCIPTDPTGCRLQADDLRAAIESRDEGGDPYARLGTLVRLADQWGLTAEGRFSPGGVVSYYAGVRFSF
jgi:hypothetical protein